MYHTYIYITLYEIFSKINVNWKFQLATMFQLVLYLFQIYYISTAERKKNVSRPEDEERRKTSARRWRMVYLGARMKNDVSRRDNEEGRISPHTGQRPCDTGAILAARYVAFSVLASRYVVLHLCAEIHFPFAQLSIYSIILTSRGRFLSIPSTPIVTVR